MKALLTLPSAMHQLAQEFARLRARDCRTCTVPTPFWGPAPEGMAGLWYLKALDPCPHGCHTVVARIWAEFTTLHDIENAPVPQRTRRRREMKVHPRG